MGLGLQKLAGLLVGATPPEYAPYKNIDGSMPSVDGQFGDPRYGVAPTISSVAAGGLLVDCNDGTIQCVRFIVNPGSDSEAGNKLANMTGDAGILFPEEDGAFALKLDGTDGEITDVYALVVGNGGTDSGGDNIVDSSTVKNINGQLATTVGTVAQPDITEAEIIAGTNMIHWEFSSTDKVRSFILKLGRTFDSDTQMHMTLRGRSYA